MPVRSGSWAPEKIVRGPLDLTHVERDALGHFASEIREQQARERRKARMSWYDIRFSDLMKLIRHRLGGKDRQIPDGLDQVDVEDIIRCIAYHFQARFGAEEEVMWEALTSWCLTNCEDWTTGWPNKSEIIIRVLAAVRGRRRDLTAIEAGKALRLTWGERCTLGLKTIRPFDMTPGQFIAAVKARKLEMDRARKEARRRMSGKPPRSEWLEANSASKDKPWLHMDPPMTRSTYYRYLKRLQSETGAALLGGTPDSREQPVSLPLSPVRQAPGPMRPGTSVRISVSRSPDHGNAGSGGYRLAATAKQEGVALYDALEPFGVSTDQSRTKRRKNA